jgi:hypothetical protein
VFTIWTTYFIAAVVASGMVVVVGWRTKHAAGSAAGQGRHGLANDPLWGDPEIDINASEARTDVVGAIRLALKRLAPVMATQSVKVDVAAPFGLLGRMRGATLADLLEEMLVAAIHAAPASRLLLTAGTRGDRIYVGITDDMPGADPAIRVASIRDLMERVAMRGASLDIDVRPAEGTTMTLRLATAVEERQEKRDHPLLETAKGETNPLIPHY